MIRRAPQRVVFLPEGRAAFEIVALKEGVGRLFDTQPAKDGGLPVLVHAFDRYPDTGWEPEIDWLYAKLACDCVDMRTIEGGQLWFDDEGKLRGRVINPIATLLYAGGAVDPIVGHALLVLDPDQHGELAEVDTQLERLRTLADEAFFSNPIEVRS